jgi:hypothetical protein
MKINVPPWVPSAHLPVLPSEHFPVSSPRSIVSALWPLTRVWSFLHFVKRSWNRSPTCQAQWFPSCPLPVCCALVSPSTPQ